jgi:hypothetical protein
VPFSILGVRLAPTLPLLPVVTILAVMRAQ